jgi:hypothetical protein
VVALLCFFEGLRILEGGFLGEGMPLLFRWVEGWGMAGYVKLMYGEVA